MENIFAVTMLVISFSLVNMFDSLETLLATAKQSGLVDENGEIIRVKQALMSGHEDIYSSRSLSRNYCNYTS